MAQKRVKNYDYIKRSDISVLKATIDGKVLNVDPKKILSGTYVAGKLTSTAKKLRVAKVDPEKLRIKMLNMYENVAEKKYNADFAEKKYNADFEKYITVADIKKFVECGLTEKMIMAFYCGFQSIMEIKADNEFAYSPIGGIFDFRTDEDGKWIKNYIARGIANCENNVFELGFKYPSFDWKKVGMKIPKTDIIETLPYDFFGKEKITILRIETFNVKTNFKVLAIKAVGDIENGERKERSGQKNLLDPKTTMELNSGYLALVSRNGKELFALAKKLLSQDGSKGAYVKDFEWLVQNKTGGAEDLIDKGYKFAKGGVTEHGLAKGDTITDDLFWENRAVVTDKNGKKVIVDLEKGKRGVKYAEGGNLERGRYIVFYADGERQVFSESTFKLIKENLYDMHPNGWERFTDNVTEERHKMAANFEKFKQSPKYDKNLSGQELWQRFSFESPFKAKGGALWGKIKSSTKKGAAVAKAKGKEYAHKAKEAARKKIHDGKKSVTLSVLEDVPANTPQEGDVLQKAMDIVYKNYQFEPKEMKSKGGSLERIEINEDGTNIPEPLYEVFSHWDEDADPYHEAERLRLKAHEVGYDFDYDLSGAPTDFWKVQKASAGYLAIAQAAKGVAPKSVDSIDTKIANRVAKKSFAERMNQTGDPEIDRDAYTPTQMATGGGVNTNEPRFYLSDNVMNELSSAQYDELYLSARRWQMQEVGGGSEFSLPEAMYLIYHDKYFPKGSKERKAAFELYRKHALNKKATGGNLSDSQYIPRDEIIKVELKNGKIIENTWSYPIYSGVRVGEGTSEAEELEKQGQLRMFSKGGNMPQYAKYIPKAQVAKIYVYDEEEPTIIKGSEIIGGVWFDNEKTEKLIAIARKQGLIK